VIATILMALAMIVGAPPPRTAIYSPHARDLTYEWRMIRRPECIYDLGQWICPIPAPPKGGHE